MSTYLIEISKDLILSGLDGSDIVGIRLDVYWWQDRSFQHICWDFISIIVHDGVTTEFIFSRQDITNFVVDTAKDKQNIRWNKLISGHKSELAKALWNNSLPTIKSGCIKNHVSYEEAIMLKNQERRQ